MAEEATANGGKATSVKKFNVKEVKPSAQLVKDAAEGSTYTFGGKVRIHRKDGTMMERVEFNAPGEYTPAKEVLQMPLYFARLHNAWHLVDVSEWEKAEARKLTPQEIASAYRG